MYRGTSFSPGSKTGLFKLEDDKLMQTGDPAGALSEFATSLRTSPNRYRAIAGAAAAAELLGDRARARAYYKMLLALCEDADGTRPELAAARRFLGGE